MSPIGKIRASIDNISTAYARILQQLPQLLQQLSPQKQTDFFALLAAIRNKIQEQQNQQGKELVWD